MVYAMATTARPKAKAVPTTVAAMALVHPRLTAVPHPMRTNTMVPIISAKYFFIMNFYLVKNVSIPVANLQIFLGIGLYL